MSYRVGQPVMVDGNPMIVCDVREDGTAYAQGEAIENTRQMICNKGVDVGRVETRVPGRCKCLASSFRDHKDNVRQGRASDHVYSGPIWLSPNDETALED